MLNGSEISERVYGARRYLCCCERRIYGMNCYKIYCSWCSGNGMPKIDSGALGRCIRAKIHDSLMKVTCEYWSLFAYLMLLGKSVC